MLKIRKATMNDLEAVFELLKQFPPEDIPEARPFEWDEGKATFKEITGNEAKGIVLIAEDGDQILGICSLSFATAIRCGGIYGAIEEFIVSSKSRGRGVGGKLLEEVISLAKEKGCYEMQVNRPSELGYPVYLRHVFLDAGRHLLIQFPKR